MIWGETLECLSHSISLFPYRVEVVEYPLYRQICGDCHSTTEMTAMRRILRLCLIGTTFNLLSALASANSIEPMEDRSSGERKQ
jgi:hypothetical protein